MAGVVVVGAGGHAKVVIELFRAMGVHVDYCISDEHAAQACLGVPVLRGDAHLARLRSEGHDRAFIAIGANAVRRRLGQQVRDLGYMLPNAISPLAVVSQTARLGEGIAIMAGAVINAETTIGDLAIINTGATVDHDGFLGEGVHIAPQCGLAGNVTIGAGTFVGIGCSIIPGIHIGQETTIGAGSVVIRDIPAHVTAAGVPAQVIKQCEYSG